MDKFVQNQLTQKTHIFFKLFSQGIKIAQLQHQSIKHRNALHPFISYNRLQKSIKYHGPNLNYEIQFCPKPKTLPLTYFG